jgi:hypothetical protein
MTILNLGPTSAAVISCACPRIALPQGSPGSQSHHVSVPNTPSVVLDLVVGSVTSPAMITGRVPAVRLLAGDSAGCVVVVVPAGGILEGRGDTAAASPARGAAAAARVPAEALVGGPGADRGAARRDPARRASQPADDGDPGYGTALASRHRSPPLGGKVPAQTDRAPGDPPQCQRPGASPGQRESGLGLPPDSR